MDWIPWVFVVALTALMYLWKWLEPRYIRWKVRRDFERSSRAKADY